MKSKKTKKALSGSVLALVLCFLMLIGTTFAWFTSSDSTAVNTIQAGTLKVGLEMWDGNEWKDASGQPLSFQRSGEQTGDILWEPGCTYTLPKVRVINEGNLALKYKVVVSAVLGDGNLAEVLDVLYSDTSKNVTDKNVGTLSDVLNSTDKDGFAHGNLTAKGTSGAESGEITLSLQMKTTAGNEYQGKSITGIAVTVLAAQDTVEYDSTTNQYDKDAEFLTRVTTEEELVKALKAGESVILGNDIALSDDFETLFSATESGGKISGESFRGILDGDGHTISNVKKVLFGSLQGGTICNLTVDAAIGSEDARSSDRAIVVNYMCGGTIDGVTVNGSLYTSEKSGGIVGRLLREGVVRNCTNNATISATSSSGGRVAGGIVGLAIYTVGDKEMTISNCKNTAAVSSDYASGGIVGMSAANVINCTNSGAISGGTSAGGIVGEQKNYGEVCGNTNSGAVTVSNTSDGCAGGIIGWIRYTTETAYQNNEIITVNGNNNSGAITGKRAAGGIVGLAYNQAVVTGNANSASAISADTFAAAIVGGLQSFSDNLNLGPVSGSYYFIVTGNTNSTDSASITGNSSTIWAWNNNCSANIQGS